MLVIDNVTVLVSNLQGLCIAIPGPTLLDLGARVNTDTEHMSLIFTARSLGYLIGSVIGGFLFDHFDQQILLFYSLFLTAIATTVAPWCVSLSALAIMISFQGISMGVLDTGGSVSISLHCQNTREDLG